MKHIITLSLCGICLLAGSAAFAQSAATDPTAVEKKSLVRNGAFDRNIIKDKEPAPYPPVHESNVEWSRMVWRTIDLREKINYPLYYPTEVMQSRRSLVQTFVQAAQSGKITLYDTDSDEFTTELNPRDIMARFGATDRTITREKMDGSGDTTVVIRGAIDWKEVQELLVKEEWYFDKLYSQMFVRIIGICPIRVYNKEVAGDEESDMLDERTKQQLFWVYYPDARKVLANTPCFTGENETSQLSFDDLLLMRRFNSYITAISNNLNNRPIASFARNDFEKMLEAERLKSELFMREQDLWEY